MRGLTYALIAFSLFFGVMSLGQKDTKKNTANDMVIKLDDGYKQRVDSAFYDEERNALVIRLK